MTDGQELNKFKLENASLKKRCDEAESELAIIKGIGNKSPEMSALQKANQRSIQKQAAEERRALVEGVETELNTSILTSSLLD